MKRFVSFLLIIFVLIAGIAIGFSLSKWGNNSGGGADDEGGGAGSSGGVASVQTTPIRAGEIAQSVTVYGTVFSEPGSQKSLSVGFESRVVAVDAVMGLRVYPGQVLLSVQATPAELLGLAQAKNDVKTADDQLQQVKEKLSLQLATRQDLIAAQDALNNAQLRLNSMQDLGIGSAVTLRATEESLVGDLPVAPGQINPAGTMLVGLLPENKILVKLSVSPSDARQLKPGQSAQISVISQGAALGVPGTISMVSGQVDPVSGFVNVYVAPDKSDGLVIGQYVSCELQTASSTGLIVPRAAVLPDGDQEDIYTVKDAHAVLHHVQVGLSNDQDVQVQAPDIQAGDPVVIMGNAELTDGMAVKQESGQ